jgi:hypothetical protein
MGLPRPIQEYESVAQWRKGLAAQWGGDPLAEDPEKLEILASFCEFTGQDPDQLVAFCFLRKKDSGARFGSAVRQKEMAGKIRAWKETLGLPPRQAQGRQNQVLSFLIHNGVSIQMGIG